MRHMVRDARVLQPVKWWAGADVDRNLECWVDAKIIDMQPEV